MKDISRLYIAVAAPIIIGLSSCSLTRQIEVVGAGHDIAYRTQIATSQEIPKRVQESIHTAQYISGRVNEASLPGLKPVKAKEYVPEFMTKKYPEYNILTDSTPDFLKVTPKKIELKLDSDQYKKYNRQGNILYFKPLK